MKHSLRTRMNRHARKTVLYMNYATVMGRTRTSTTVRRREHDSLAEQMSEKLRGMGFQKRHVDAWLADTHPTTLQLYRDDYRDEDAVKDIVRRYLPSPETLEDILAVLKKREATVYERMLRPLVDTCYTFDQLLDMVIEHAVGMFQPVGVPGKPYYFHERGLNEWFDEGGILHCNCSAPRLRHVKALVRSVLKRRHIDDAAVITAFHATNWESALSIAATGPDFMSGRRCLDFGIRPSFYITPDVGDALQWCDKRGPQWGCECAVVVFALAKTDIRQARHETFERPDAEWKRLTQSSRMCRLRKNALDDCDVVHGPMVANPHECSRGKESRPHAVVKYQYASKSTTFDETLHRSIAGILWFRKD